MSFSCHVHTLPYLPSYESAEGFFNKTKPMRGKSMPENERPMHHKRGGAYKKYRVAKVEVHGREAYDLILFDTPVIRYFKPNPDGSRHISLRIYPSISTTKFAQYHGWMRQQMLTTEGSYVYVYYPLKYKSELTAFLTLDIDNRLDTSRSWHQGMCKYLSSAEDKQNRKEFKKHLDVVFDLLYVQEFSIREQAAASLGKSHYYGNYTLPIIDDLTKYVNAKIYNPNADVMLHPGTLGQIVDRCAQALKEEASNEAYREMNKNPELEYNYHNWHKRQDYLEERKPQLVATLDMKKVITKVRNEMLSSCGFMKQTNKITLPLFPTERHKGSIYTDRDSSIWDERTLLGMYK
jgi:hypothetical protein